jgi:hypothetical protein
MFHIPENFCGKLFQKCRVAGTLDTPESLPEQWGMLGISSYA